MILLQQSIHLIAIDSHCFLLFYAAIPLANQKSEQAKLSRGLLEGIQLRGIHGLGLFILIELDVEEQLFLRTGLLQLRIVVLDRHQGNCF